MKNKTIVVFLCFVFLCLFLRSQVQTEKDDSEKTMQSELEHFLRTAQITNIEKGKIAGRTAAWKITLEDESQLRYGIFKYVHHYRPTLLADSYTYELAAYELDKLLDFGSVPPVVEREIGGIKGSLQIRIENCFGLDAKMRQNLRPPDEEAFQNRLEELNVFENLVYCERKELDDVLIHQESWDLCRVDFGEAFDPTPELIPDQKIIRCSKKLFQNLQSLDNDVIKTNLEIYINEEEISALLKRKTLIIKTITELIKEKGEEAVLF